MSDNERFLKTAEAKKLYRQNAVILEYIPSKSPDLNPVEKFWSWLRSELGKKDLDDLKKKRPVPNKQAYKRRVIQLCGTQAAKEKARNIFLGLPGVCQKVFKKKGAASRT